VGIGYPVLYLHLFKASLLFPVDFCLVSLWALSPFSVMPKRIGLCKLFTKLCCYRTLYSFLSGEVVNYLQRS
jgi:hypothetical protein